MSANQVKKGEAPCVEANVNYNPEVSGVSSQVGAGGSEEKDGC